MISFLNILRVLLMGIEVVAVSTIVLIGVDYLAYHVNKGRQSETKTHAAKTKESVKEMMRKERLRREKEESAHEGFFEEFCVRGFDTNGAIYTRIVKVPTETAREYYKQMDELTDAEIFLNTEEL